jgi:hypothetical protein
MSAQERGALRPIRLVFELSREENPRLFDELSQFRQGRKRVNRLRLLAYDGLLAQHGVFAMASSAHVPQKPLDFSFPLLYREEWNDNTRSSARYQLLNPSR